jgi:CheY-like chemotaxis protein
MGTLLKNHVAKVWLAASVREAMKVIEEVVPDAIISDLGMPDEDGYAFIAKVRALSGEEGGLAPAIALTGYATSKDKEQALAAGYQLHMAKPVEPEALVAAVARLTGVEQHSSIEPAT